jgi:hypothetical protein
VENPELLMAPAELGSVQTFTVPAVFGMTSEM